MAGVETSPGRSGRTRESFYGRLAAVRRPYTLSDLLRSYDLSIEAPPGSYLRDRQTMRSYGERLGNDLLTHARETGMPVRDVFGRFVLDYCPSLFPDSVVSAEQQKGQMVSDAVTILPFHVYRAAESMETHSEQAAIFLYGALGMTPETARGTFQQLWHVTNPNHRLTPFEQNMIAAIERVYGLVEGQIK